MNDKVIQEVLDRVRRIETRVTKFLEEQGFDTQVRRPVWRAGEIIIPSMACSFKDALGVVPRDWDNGKLITIVHQDTEVAHLYRI